MTNNYQNQCCNYCIDPFADVNDLDPYAGYCQQTDTVDTTFRRKSDGELRTWPRCKDHIKDCNDKWEFVAVFTLIQEVEFK